MKLRNLVAVLMALAAGPALADITIGVTVSATGPAAALGGPQKNTVTLLPTTVAGERINWIVLDDATDPGSASKNATKFITEDHADIIVGSSTTANTAAMVDAITESKTPLLSLSPIDLPAEK
ncbi:MAG TPA: ABC transporter substrate-binding protein, partial [Burkholderiaceae bacterium]|nr:ABC transporter substrate-binding protein [Burkholderiaceae bacterium]